MTPGSANGRGPGRGVYTGPRCDARKRQGAGTCRKPAGWGTDHLGFGRCRLHTGATRDGRVHAARQQATAELAQLGQALETDPHAALEQCVHLMAGQVAFIKRKIAELGEDESMSGEALHPWVRALDAAIDRLSRVAKTAIDAGVEERRVQLEELVVERMATVIGGVLDDLDLTPAQRNRAKASLAQHLSLLNDLGHRPAELVA